MKTKSLIMVLIFVSGFITYSNAQIGGSLRNRINKALTKDAGNKADSLNNENQDQEQDEENSKGKSRGIGLGKLLGGNTDIKHNEVYDFTGRIYMQMETYEKKEVNKSDYYTYFNANTLSAGIEVKFENPDSKEESVPTSFVFDMENRCFMILLQGDDSKTGIISAIPDDSTMNANAKARNSDDEVKPVITKTGNSRVIAGYKCDEYKVVEPGKDEFSTVWMTRDVKIQADKRYWGKAGMPTYYNYPGFEDSMMLAMDAYDKDGKLAMKMETKEINENFKHSISTKDYSLIKMNFGQAGKK